MTRSLTVALVVLALMAGVPAALASEEPAATTTTTTIPEPPPAEEPPLAEEPPPPEAPRVPKHRVRRVDVRRAIVFPVVGVSKYYGGFGACRDNCEREHHGVDIMTYGWKGIPVVAAHDGHIRLVRDDRSWCTVEITAPDGWYTRYVHLNNDTPGYDDRDYACSVPGIEPGAAVDAGQIIGWIGDSGNAEWTPPHLHFEIRMPNGLPVDPYRSLKAAHRIRFQKVGGEDLIDTAAQVAEYAYRNGSGVVNVMATTDYTALLAGGFSALELSGPLLLSEPNSLPDPTVEMFDRLGAGRVILVGNGLGRAVVDQLHERFSIVERVPMPGPVPESYIEPDSGDIVEIPRPRPSPLSLVVVGDRTELPEGSADDLGRTPWRVPTIVLEGTDPARRIGRHTYQGPGRSGQRNVLYYQTGDGYTRIRAREAPETPPDYGVVVIDVDRTSEAALTFLQSLADLPAMPLWR